MRRRTLLAAVGAALVLAAPARAATFTVNTTADSTTCNATTCSLRGAVLAAAANGTAEQDQIVLTDGTYILNSSLDMTEIGAATAITITGAGANRTSIQPPAPLGTYRVLTTATGANLTLRNLTVRNGANASNAGGNIFVNTNATLTLDGVRVTGGRSGVGGGGIVAFTGTTLNIANSLIDNNLADTGTGGGIRTQGTLNISDSTIALNKARSHGGIHLPTTGSATLRGVTVAFNETINSQPPTAGGITSVDAPVSIQGSIIAGNISLQNVGGVEQKLLVNCGISAPVTDGGGNIEDADYCKLSAGKYTNPQLATVLDETQQPPTLNIAAGSPAIDVADCGGRALDQRGMARPQGVRCDAGAFELVQVAQPPPTQTPTPTPTPQAAPTPVPGQSVVVDEVKGTVKIKLPNTNRYIDLDAVRGIPVGSTLDTRKGTVELTSIPRPGQPAETARFYDGIFKVTQVNGITILTLTEALAPCPKGSASSAAKKPKKRKLWGEGKGAFRTVGKYSAATVRGTKWLVEDSCAGTLTRVTQGAVTVRDNVLKKNIVLRAPKRYLAKPKR